MGARRLRRLWSSGPSTPHRAPAQLSFASSASSGRRCEPRASRPVGRAAAEWREKGFLAVLAAFGGCGPRDLTSVIERPRSSQSRQALHQAAGASRRNLVVALTSPWRCPRSRCERAPSMAPRTVSSSQRLLNASIRPRSGREAGEGIRGSATKAPDALNVLPPRCQRGYVRPRSPSWRARTLEGARRRALTPHAAHKKKPPAAAFFLSGRRDSNPRRQPWQGCTLPLSYSRNLGPFE